MLGEVIQAEEDGNLNIQKEMKSTRNGNCVGKYKDIFIMEVCLKNNQLFKAKTIIILGVITYLEVKYIRGIEKG